MGDTAEWAMNMGITTASVYDKNMVFDMIDSMMNNIKIQVSPVHWNEEMRFGNMWVAYVISTTV